ncbi:TonB-dependent receptor [Henriciella litoralis]|uniref:TonB-dependent receptor n=1 Tax=Henriciella litoralis TaxID=568102 RepID=UPI000A077FD3|nr:TonB-dependent receptor [Henriciella litoralis]
MKLAPRKNASARGMKLALCASVGFSALMALPGLTASAQEEEGADTQRRLNAVVVEATRRSGVTVQDVPVSVTAFDASMLEDTGVARLNDIEQIAPSVQISQTESAASGTSISIRGVGTGSNNPGFEPAVGVVIDGVFRTKTGIALSEMPELASLEVLRGPQGTLFGRNTSAGVVSINTAKPQFAPEGYAKVGVGNYNMYDAELMVTGPISENVAGRVDVLRRVRDGYIDDVNSSREFNNLDRFLMRGQLLFEKDDASLRVIGDYGQTDEDCCVSVNFNPGPLGAAVNAGAAMAGLVGISPTPPKDLKAAISPNRDISDDVEEFGFSAEYRNRVFGDANLVSITAYRDWKALRDQDIDFSGIDRAYRDGTEIGDKVFTQEVRLQDTYGRLDWLVGAFYMNQETNYDDTIRVGTQANLYTDLVAFGAAGGQVFGSLDPTGTVVPSLLGNIDPLTGAPAAPGTPGTVPFFIPGFQPGEGQNTDNFKQKTNAFALFTHNEISLTDKLTATVGLRANYEEKKVEYDLDGNVTPCNFFAAQPGVAAALGQLALLVCNPAINSEFSVSDSDSFDETTLTGTAKLAYAFTPDIMAYASYSRGFKSGGYNLDRSGFDSVIFGGDGPQPSDLLFDSETVDAYEIGWKTSYPNLNATLNGAIFYQEVADFQENLFTGTNFRTFNSDVESYGLELDTSLAPMDGLTIQGGYAYTIAERKNDILVPSGTGTLQLLAPGGVQLVNVPEHVVTGSGTYLFDISDSLRGLVHLNARYNSETALSVTSQGLTDNDAYVLVGARAGIQSADGTWEFSIFGENLTDEYYNFAAFGVPEQTGTNAVYPGTPRMYGAELKVNF